MPGFGKLKTAATQIFSNIFYGKKKFSASLELLVKAVAVLPFEQGVSTFCRTLFLEGRIPVGWRPACGSSCQQVAAVGP